MSGEYEFQDDPQHLGRRLVDILMSNIDSSTEDIIWSNEIFLELVDLYRDMEDDVDPNHYG